MRQQATRPVQVMIVPDSKMYFTYIIAVLPTASVVKREGCNSWVTCRREP